MSTIQLRRGTAAQWTTANPILADGELGVETDTGKVKAGDGVNPWVVLQYVGGASAADLTAERTAVATLQNHIISGAQNTITNLPASAVSTGVFNPSRLATGTMTGAKFLRDDGTWQNVPGGGDALVASGLSQFASGSTTSTQFRALLTNPNGTGAAVFTTGAALVAPTGIVKADVGLGNVDNVSDANKPISSAAQAVLDTKATLGVFPQVLITSARSVLSTDIGKEVHNATGTARTLTIDNTATSGIAWVPGKFFGAGRSSTGTLTVAAGIGVTIVNGDGLTVDQDVTPLLYRMSQTTDRWIVS